MTIAPDEMMRVENGWWCDLHQEVHLGEITSFIMEHRTHLHPLFFYRRQETGR